MSAKSSFDIAVLPGDGIGIDVTQEAVRVLAAVEKAIGTFTLRLSTYPSGAICYRETGCDLPPATLDACRKADAVLLGAMGHPDIRKPDGTELTPQVTLRVLLDLFAGVRPCKLYAGARTPLASVKPGEIDLVILREQTEGLFASQTGGIVLHDDLAADTLIMTRRGVERICEFAFRLARLRKVTCVDKANIFKSYAFFRKVFDEVAGRHPAIATERVYVDAHAFPGAAARAVRRDRRGEHVWRHPVRFGGGPDRRHGDGPVGGHRRPSCGLPAGNGTAPDIAGKGIANPIAAILSAGMMLDWLGRRHRNDDLLHGAASIEQAVANVLAEGKKLPADQGGSATTQEVGEAVGGKLSAGSCQLSALSFQPDRAEP